MPLFVDFSTSERFCDRAEAATILNLTEEQVFDLVKGGKLAEFRQGGRKKEGRYYLRESLAKLLAERQQQ